MQSTYASKAREKKKQFKMKFNNVICPKDARFQAQCTEKTQNLYLALQKNAMHQFYLYTRIDYFKSLLASILTPNSKDC